MTLIDTNVLLDLVTDDPVWAQWSIDQLEAASLRGPLLVNDVVYAELSVRYERIEDIEAVFERSGDSRCAYAARGAVSGRQGLCLLPQGGGTRTGVLPDFFIGAHAAVNELPLLTRDRGRYARYFPSLSLISPEAED
ncbi:type II toxin-antitoxin system VapC family toxin [Ancylobacter polymorphus]|uniref:type II toxin-antitoxin system VapC family toxin n=1 Tax=Ancylobacter polymorphus TaxID=223390 RepID=UPI0032665152